jgi:hypothetical protein
MKSFPNTVTYNRTDRSLSYISYIKNLLTFPEKKSYNPSCRVTEGVNPDNGFAPFFILNSGGFIKNGTKKQFFSHH